jgi:hypothetical protein
MPVVVVLTPRARGLQKLLADVETGSADFAVIVVYDISWTTQVLGYGGN